MLTQQTLQFLENLSENNNREWFHANKTAYETAKSNFEQLCEEILTNLKTIQDDLHNTKVKDCIFRINRDIRFSANKAPYKKYFSAGFGPGGRSSKKADFYLHIQPNESLIGGGYWESSATQLATLRQEIDYNPENLKSIIYEKNFKSYYTEIWGEKLKKAPKGYPADHPDVELLKYKQMFFFHRFTNEEILNPNFPQEVLKACQTLKPYLDYVNRLFFEEE